MNKIKIVKKDEKRAPRAKKLKIAQPRDKAREMVATVSDWVTEFKERKTVETKAAFDLFTGPDTRLNES